MTRRILGKVAMAATLMVACGMVSPSKANAGWLTRGRGGDCDGGLTHSQIKAMTACELARAKRLADLSCAELSQIAESDRHSANLRALTMYHQRLPMHTSQPAR